MSGMNTVNALGLAAAITASAMLTGLLGMRAPEVGTVELDPEGRAFVQDATGTWVPVHPYARIVSASTIADQVLVRLIEQSRVLAVSNHTLRHGDEPWRYEGKLGVGTANDIETILQLRPDIVFVNGFADVRHLQRLEEAGVTVFNLGEMRGLDTLRVNIEQIATTLGVPDRGEALARDFERRLAAVGAGVPPGARQRALYVGLHGDRLYGGTAETSFHDVMTAAGLIDMAAEAGYTGWPAYTSEELLALDPPWIITSDRTERAFCRHPGFMALSACKERQVRGIATDLLTDPGLGMLRAAEAVHDAVYR